MKKYFLPILFIFYQIACFAQDFKVIGYLPYYRFEIIEQIDFTKITHLNLAFLNPDIHGNLDIGGWDIDPIVAQAKSKNPALKVFISIAGGHITEEWEDAYDLFLLPENRSDFAHLLVEFANLHHLDGIDVDLEWSYVNEYYSPFILVLADSLKSHGKKITAALPATHRYSDLTQEALDTFDFINLMVYDKTGPWRPNDPGPHSPRSFTTQSISYWKNQGLVYSKMTLGVPFYGWDFSNQSNVTAFTFGSLVGQDNHHAYADQVGEKYYNGIPTIQYKTLLAMNEELAGVMIWELGQDALGPISEYSLLSAIDFVVQTGEVEITGFEDLLVANKKPNVRIYPNPFQNDLTIQAKEDLEINRISIFDLQGREQRIKKYSNAGVEQNIDISNLSQGMYILKIVVDGVEYTEKIIKTS